MPIVQAPALPTGLRASLQLATSPNDHFESTSKKRNTRPFR